MIVPAPRFFEVDCARAVALVMMLVSNFLTTLDFFGIYDAMERPVWFWLARVTAVLFVGIAGLSLALNAHRAAAAAATRGEAWRRIALRGARILAWALVVTAVTWVIIPDAYVRWGVLHLIGFGVIASLPLLGRPLIAVALAAALLALGDHARSTLVDFSWLIWLGYGPPTFWSVDYFPVAPWYAVFLLGLAAGHLLYPAGARAFRAPWSDAPGGRARRVIGWLGTHTLGVYLVHQPVFVVALVVTGVVPMSALA